MSVSFSGLASGLDTASIVSQLVAAERSPATTLQSQQSDLTTQKSIVNSLSSALSAFGDAVAALNTPSQINLRTATSSDSHVSVAASSDAAATVHDVRVQQLARGQITASNSYASQVAGVAGTGTLQMTSGSKTASISYDSTDTLASIASKINDANIGASASVLYDGSSYRLMVAATATGTAAAPQFTETGSGLGLSDPANVKVAAKDAIATIDGVDVTRPTNVMADAINGLTFTLNSVTPSTDPSSNVAVTLDQSALTTKLNTLVSTYNQVNAALHVQLDYTGTKKGTSTLFGDSTLRQLQGAMSSLMTNTYGSGDNNSLSSIGLSIDKTGGLTLDTSKLTTALASSSSAVSDVFLKGGFAAATAKMTDAYTRTSDGILSTKVTSLTSQYTNLQTRIDQINTRADALETQLNAQFTALETAMSSLKSQQSYLSSVLGTSSSA